MLHIKNMEEYIKKYIGIKIKTLRENAKLTQDELAEECNISWRTISNIERGQVMPDLRVVCALASFFHLSTDELLRIESKTTKSNYRLLQENRIIEKIRACDDNLLTYIGEQIDIILKHFK